MKRNGNLNNFADRMIAIGRVPKHDDKRYIKLLKSRTGVIDDELIIYKIYEEKPRFRCIGNADEDEVLEGNYKEPKEIIPEDVVKKWYQDNLADKGYGTIAREYYKLEPIEKNDSDEIKKRKNTKMEICTNKVRNAIRKYKESLNKLY